MPTFKEFEVWIESDDMKFEEYDVKVADDNGTGSTMGKTTTCWIASEVDKVSILYLKKTSYWLTVRKELHYRLEKPCDTPR